MLIITKKLLLANIDNAKKMLSRTLKNMIDNKEMFGLSDEDQEVMEAKKLLRKIEGEANE